MENKNGTNPGSTLRGPSGFLQPSPSDIKLMRRIATKLEEWIKPEPNEKILTRHKYVSPIGYCASLIEPLEGFGRTLDRWRVYNRGGYELLKEKYDKLCRSAREADGIKCKYNKLREVGLHEEQAEDMSEFSATMSVKSQVVKLAETLKDMAQLASEELSRAEQQGHEHSSQDETKYVFCRKGDKWQTTFTGESYYINDTKGMYYIACLLGKPNNPISAFQLKNPMSDAHVVSQGKLAEYGTLNVDSAKHELSDREALQSYNHRLHEIKEELNKAKKANDQALEERLEKEKEQILNCVKSSSKATGLSKMFTNETSKAAKAVGEAIRRAIEKIKEYDKPLYQHLNNSIKCGQNPVYNPDRPIRWEL